MARAAKVKTEVETTPPPSIQGQRPNIEGLDLLKKEFHSGKMPDRKLIALRTKLVALYNDQTITEKEQDLMETILRKDRALGRIVSSYNYLLSAIENARCEETAVVKDENAPVVHHLKKNLECKFTYDPEYNDGKGKEDSLGRYHVYVPRVIPPEHQLSVKTAMKEIKGHPTTAEDYPPEKILYHRITLKKREFMTWFEVEDDELLNPQNNTPVYTF